MMVMNTVVLDLWKKPYNLFKLARNPLNKSARHQAVQNETRSVPSGNIKPRPILVTLAVKPRCMNNLIIIHFSPLIY